MTEWLKENAGALPKVRGATGERMLVEMRRLRTT